MAVTYYGSIDSVLIRTGVKPEDLGFLAVEGEPDPEAPDDFGDFIVSLLEEAADVMDRKMRISYLPELTPIPAGLHGIANDVVSDSLRAMVVGRQTPVVRIDDFAVRTLTARLMSPDILERLKLYSAGQGAGSYDVGQDTIGDYAWTLDAADLDTVDL